MLAVRRDTGEKLPISQDGLVERVQALLEEIQATMFQKALAFREAHSYQAETLAELAGILQEKTGFVLAGWCGDDACELKVKEETKATARNIPFDPPERMARCLVCGREAQHTVWYARAYSTRFGVCGLRGPGGQAGAWPFIQSSWAAGRRPIRSPSVRVNRICPASARGLSQA